MGFARRHPSALIAMLVVAATVVTTAVLAISAHGYPARHLSLNDGGVWVSSDKDGLVGRLNKPAGSLDLALNPPGGAQQAYQLDVRQDGAAVVSWDQASGKLYPVDVDSGKTIDNQGIPVSSGEQVELSGGTLAVLDPSANRVWAERVDATTGVTSLAGVDPSAKPIASFGAAAVSSGAAQGAALAVGTDGTVYAATVHGKFATIRQDGDGFAKPVYSQLDASLQSIQLTAVGTRPVILDAKAGSVVLPGGQNTTITANAESALQQPSPSGDAVIVATPTQLLSVPLDGAKPSSLYDGGGGKPASPTWLGACVYAAWPGTPGVYVHSCGGGVATPGKLESEQELVDPVFRVNRDTILLNDLSTGAVYDLDTLQQVDDWSAAKPPPIEKKTDTKKNKNDNSTAARDLPPKATDVTLGARPGRTTVLHLLDYDSDPQGYVLAIDAVSLVGSSGATLSISPDAQTVEITMPSQGGDVHFSYTIDDGKGAHASADVTVQRRLPDQNQAPALRRGFQQHTFSVAAGGSLDQPVLGDWRDFDGDPVVLAGVDPSAGTVTRTPDGQLDYVAPATGGPQTITYEVSDGIAPPVSHKIPITVLAPDSNKSVAPTAEPDTARGQTGKPITIEPLANDLPGVDPNNPHATLSLAGDLASPAGATIVTDLKTGVVTLTASRKNTYLLSYTAAYGDAPYSRGTIRVDVTDPPASPLPPIAMPDTAAIYGQAPATVDVLANDFDPAGGVLVVQHAAPVSANQLQVAIVDGRWLRINALTPSITPGTETVDYTITDGRTNPVTGQVTVTQLPPPADDTPVAVDDYATVRAGDSVSIPVLSNDVDPDGAELSLLDDVSSAPRSGQLSVTSATGSTVGVGAAFVSGSQVRYVPPAVVTATESVTIAYVAKNPTGEQTTGTAHVTINPAPTPKNPDHAPVPQAVTARIVAGDSVTISVPTTGIDPDGDTATITGLASAPTLGRVLATSPTSVSYEAFPTSAGTDTFSYLVTDRYGLTGQATISVGVVPPGQPQPPVAVNESLTAAPHSTLRVDVLSNAVIAADDTVTITPLSRTNPDLAAGIRLASASGPIVLTTPAASSKPMVVLYSLTDGIGSPSPATLTVHVQAGYVAAPIALDATAVPKAKATTVTVNLLGKDSDPTGSALHISRVFDGRAVVSGSSVTLPLLDHLQNVPYEITAANGATAAAVIHVPAAGAGGPYPVPNQLITMKENGTKTVDIADYVKDPLGKKLQLTTTSQLHAAPGTDLHLVGASGTSLKLTAANSYIGPAAITFQVTDGSSLHDPHGQLAVITVPVQIGPDTPVLRCPSDRISLVEGGAPATVDVTSVCHVWVPDPSELKGLRYSASWSKQPGSVTVGGAGTHRLTLSAGSAAVPGSTGVLSVGVSGTDAVKAQLDVVVLPLGPPSMSPIVIDGFTAGSTATRNITGSVSSELRDPVVSVVSIHQNSGMPSTVTKSGATVRITPSRASHGVMTYQVVVTDVADRTRKDRYATGSITLDVLNVPDAPGAPTAGRTTLSRVVQLSWPTPQNNGAPIDYYRVLWAGGSQRCAASPCSITGLVNGHKYAFTVEAHNAVGFSRPSPALSPPAEPDALPGAVAHLSVTQPADGAVTLVWTAAPDIGSAVQSYQLTWSGGGSASVAGTARRITARGLANDNVYTFTIVAKNRVGNGPPTSTQGESAGTPSTPGSVAVQYANAAGTTTRVVTVSWTASDPNGAGPSTYTVTRNGTAICSAVTATSCTDTPASGSTYTYSVTASNAAGHVSAAGSTSFAVAGTPDTVAGLNAAHTTVDGQLALAYTVPNSHGADSTIKCSYSTGGSCPSWTPAGAPGSQATQVFSGLPNDTAVSVTVTDCNSQQCGAPATSNAAVTDGPPSAPTNPSCGLSGDTVTFSWGRPAAINGYAVSFVLSGASSGSTNATSWSKSYPEDGANHTLTVTSHDSREAGGATSITCPDKSNPPPPPETVKVNMVAYSTGYSGCSAGCHLIQVTLTNFAANHTYTVNAQAPHPYSGGDGTLVMRTDGNGNYSGTPGPWYGYNDSVTVTVDGHSDTCSGSWGKPTGSCS